MLTKMFYSASLHHSHFLVFRFNTCFFFILRSFTVGCGKSKIFASPVLFLLFSFFLLLFSVIFLFLNEINDDDDDDFNDCESQA